MKRRRLQATFQDENGPELRCRSPSFFIDSTPGFGTRARDKSAPRNAMRAERRVAPATTLFKGTRFSHARCCPDGATTIDWRSSGAIGEVGKNGCAVRRANLSLSAK